MSLEDIQKKIISDAEKKKAEIIAEAERNSSSLLSKAKQLAENYRKDQEKSIVSKGESIERGLIIDARRKLMNEKLLRKRKRIEQVFSQAKEIVFQSSDYSVFMKKLVLESVTTKDEEILLGKNETILDQDWLDDINKTLSAKLSFAKEKGDFEGGIFLVGNEFSVNISLEMLFQLLREETEKPVADILFKG